MESLQTTNIKEAYELGKLLLVIDGITDVKVNSRNDGFHYIRFLINFNDIEVRTTIITLINEYGLTGINFDSKWTKAKEMYEVNK